MSHEGPPPPPPPGGYGTPPPPGSGGPGYGGGQYGGGQYGGGQYGGGQYGGGQYGGGQYGGGQYGGGPMGGPPPNYLVWSILSTVFCCLPLGIASIVYAAQVNSKWAAGDAAGAMESSRKAKQFATWSAIAFVALVALYIVIGVGGVLTSST